MKMQWIIFLSLGVLMCAGCSHQTAEQKEAQNIGAGMEKSGTMSQKDYVQVRALEHQVSGSHTISEADLDWDLAFLKRSDNGIARARGLTVISDISPISDAQRAKISPVVTPFLNSPDALTQQSARRVQHQGGLL